MESFKEREVVFRERVGRDFTQIYTEYFPKLVFFTNKYLNDRQVAEDVVVDTFMDALSKIETFDTERVFSTWLYAIARNNALQYNKKKRTVSIDVEFSNGSSVISLKDMITEYSDDTIKKEEVIELKVAIMRDRIEALREPLRTTVIMREIKNMKYEDISLELGINLSTVKSRIRNGRLILMKETEAEFKKIDLSYE